MNLHLNQKELANPKAWTDAGIKLPKYDRAKVIAATKAAPVWVHCGAGNIFRVFPAGKMQALLNIGGATTGIVVAEGYDYEIIDAVFAPHDNLSLSVTLKANGTIDKEVIGSMAEALKMDATGTDWPRLKEVFRSPSLQMVSFTITEKGYSLEQNGSTLPGVEADFAAGPAAPKSYIGKVAALVHERFQAGALPLALVSMDNCSHNGDRIRDAVHAFARAWTANGKADGAFLAYVQSEKIGYPWSMIDKITPRPDDGVKKMLKDSGFADVEPVITKLHTYVAPFVNAEEAEYLVIEDTFPNGRPALEKTGIIFTDKTTVDRVEKMKVCTCLNPLHLGLSMYGSLLGFKRICDTMRDADLRRMVEIIGRVEGMPVVVDPGIIKPADFIDEVLNVRFPNPFMPDTPQRIACDMSQKMSIRYGETIKAYIKDPNLDVMSLKVIPLVHAGWLRYLVGVDDNGQKIELSPDPRLPDLTARLKGLKLGDIGPFSANLRPILSDAVIFGLNLYDCGLAERIEGYFAELMAGPGAVRRTIQKYIA